MSKLRQISFPIDLDTSSFDVAEVLFNPGLAVSNSYDRGVGFFSSGWLRNVASGLSQFAERNGKVRLIASPILSKRDFDALKEGEELKNNPKILAALSKTLDDIEKNIIEKPLSVLTWMIADGLLDIKLAVPVKKLDGDFHTKVGVFSDNNDDFVVFHGSQNESDKGFRNYETLDVFLSWEGGRDAQRASRHRQRFEDLWEEKDLNVNCFDLPSAVRERIIKITEQTKRPYDIPKAASSENTFKWRHQKEALSQFLKVRNGVLEMATGTGKTRTALNIIECLLNEGHVKNIIITMSGTDLMDQWWRELIRRFTKIPIFRQYGGKKELSEFLTGTSSKVLLISRLHLKKLLPIISETDFATTLIVCDEVHGMGSPSMVRDLSDQIKPIRYRLGLSATPEREYDEEGTRFIAQEIGNVIFKFGLKEAIEREILCKFDYCPLNYSLSVEDRQEIANIIKRHHAKIASGEQVSDEALYRDLARVRKVTHEKLPVFSQYLKKNPNFLERSLIFVETTKFGNEVQRILVDAGVPYHTYFQSDERTNLERFASGQLDCLISCHRLSEGIDIQSVRTIVLFSSARAKLETVQRLGRCLRIDPNDPTKRALVVDFVDMTEDENSGDYQRSKWFAELASIV